MNMICLEPLVGDGTDQPVEVPAGYHLMLHPSVDVIVRTVPGGVEFTIPGDAVHTLHAGSGQTVFINCPADGTVQCCLV